MSELAKSAEILLEVAPRLQGSFIDRLSYAAGGTRDCLDIWLTQTQGLGEVVLSLEQVRYFTMEKPAELEQSFVDDFQIFLLPQSGDWPDGAEQRVQRFPGLPELVWIRMIGPAEVDVISSILTVANRMRS